MVTQFIMKIRVLTRVLDLSLYSSFPYYLRPLRLGYFSQTVNTGYIRVCLLVFPLSKGSEGLWGEVRL